VALNGVDFEPSDVSLHVFDGDKVKYSRTSPTLGPTGGATTASMTVCVVLCVLFLVLYTILSSILIYSYPLTHPSILSLLCCDTL
jgi:hypothetical protein